MSVFASKGLLNNETEHTRVRACAPVCASLCWESLSLRACVRAPVCVRACVGEPVWAKMVHVLKEPWGERET